MIGTKNETYDLHSFGIKRGEVDPQNNLQILFFNSINRMKNLWTKTEEIIDNQIKYSDYARWNIILNFCIFSCFLAFFFLSHFTFFDAASIILFDFNFHLMHDNVFLMNTFVSILR